MSAEKDRAAVFACDLSTVAAGKVNPSIGSLRLAKDTNTLLEEIDTPGGLGVITPTAQPKFTQPRPSKGALV